MRWRRQLAGTARSSCGTHLSAERLHVLLLHEDEDKAAGHQAPHGQLGQALQGGQGGCRAEGDRSVRMQARTFWGSVLLRAETQPTHSADRLCCRPHTCTAASPRPSHSHPGLISTAWWPPPLPDSAPQSAAAMLSTS